MAEKIFIADKETLDTVNTKVGTSADDSKTTVFGMQNRAENILTAVQSTTGATGDTGGSSTAGTLMGKLNALISSLATHVANWTAAKAANLDTTVSSRQSEANALTRYNTLNTNTTVNNTASSTGTLSQKLAYIISQLATISAKGAVKSIQKGTVLINASTITVTISEVDPSKSMVILDGYSGASGSSGTGRGYTILYSLASTQMVLSCEGTSGSTYTWNASYQIIEFY